MSEFGMTISEAVTHFHFLRPLWLLSIFPACLLVWLLLKHKSSAANWRGTISEHLLGFLSDGMQNRSSRTPFYLLLLGWVLAAIALAGPSWNKLPQPVHQRMDALVIIVDLSLSMLAEDIKPSRLVRAHHKVLDIVQQRREGLTALIAYSGDAHVVTPLTDDVPTISNLVPSLSPLIMPVIGSDPVAAVNEARKLFLNAGINQGRVLLITDGITDSDLEELGSSFRSNGLTLSILGIGTRDGAPIPADQGFLKDNQGNIIVPQLLRRPLEELAANNSGRYTDITLDDSDIRFLLPAPSPNLDETTILTDREFDQWLDRGSMLAFVLLPLALASFRRGWLLSLAFPLLLTIAPQKSYALEWQDLWQRSDQRAAKQLAAGDAKAAAETFSDPQWKASAKYRAEDYRAAAELFSKSDSANAHYNRGNALARTGNLTEAIEAYEQALALDANMEDARFNKQLLEQVQQNQEQNQSQGQDQEQQDQDQEQEQEQEQEQQRDGQKSQQQQNNDQESQQSDGSNQDGQQGDQQQSEQKNQQRNTDQNQDGSEENKSAQQKLDEQNNKNDKEQASMSSANDSQEKPQQPQAANQQAPADRQTEQQRQATEQWLRQIPDDPSGLLRRKFDYESRRRQQQNETTREQPQW